MMQILGYIFLSILVSIILLVTDYYLPGNFLSKFINDGFIETFAVLVGLNLTATIFLLSQLICFEEKFANNDIFQNTRSEIRQNSFFLLVCFCLTLVILIIRPDLGLAVGLLENLFYYISTCVIVALFILSLFTIFEILGAVFILSKNPK